MPNINQHIIYNVIIKSLIWEINNFSGKGLGYERLCYTNKRGGIHYI